MNSPTLPELIGVLPDATVVARVGCGAHGLGQSPEAYTAREGRWRCCSHGLKDRLDLCRYVVWQAIEELDRGRRARRVVVLVALEEVDQPRLRHGHHGGAGPPQTPPASPPPPPFKGKLFSRKGGR